MRIGFWMKMLNIKFISKRRKGGKKYHIINCEKQYSTTMDNYPKTKLKSTEK